MAAAVTPAAPNPVVDTLLALALDIEARQSRAIADKAAAAATGNRLREYYQHGMADGLRIAAMLARAKAAGGWRAP
jgi:hypothetical protein